ncbi:MAG: ACP S-malonyltransferase [Lentisphaeria bacterium]|nr:ACP S-malonyltransferase [Lentisphaeria bacterium]NQZ67724.1 ACP S-malonyltransferase [Lentisphaeria bacterium]
MTTIYMFPGQGSQKKGMGADLFDKYPDICAQADDILGYSIKELCLEDPNDKLGSTDYTQPALYTVNALSFLNEKEENGQADIAIGHSLGEYNALFAAAAYDFSTGLKLVQKRGELMSKAKGGGMAAIVGLDIDSIKKSLAENQLDSIDIANYNSPGQTVITGAKEDIEAAQDKFEEARMVVVLKVSGAFHSRHMKDAADEFADFIMDMKFNDLEIPVIANCTAQAYANDNIAENLVKQIHNSVYWVDTIMNILAEDAEAEFKELGPGKVLAGLLRQIK